MAFTTEQSKVPAAIGDIEIVLFDSGTGGDKIRYSVQILQASGEIFTVKTGDLLPHLTTAQISALQSFAADMRAKATNEFLPE